MGAEIVDTTEQPDVVAVAREWSGGQGPPVVIDATGDPSAIQGAVKMVASAGRVVVTGISDKDVALPVGSFTAKELDVIGVSCCAAREFEEAVEIVARRRGVVEGLITHEYPLERAPEALTFAMEHPAEVMKVVIRVEERP
jgi:L-gulonate 5-dehydrogenase